MLISLMLVMGSLIPAAARASVLGAIIATLTHAGAQSNAVEQGSDLQTLELPRPAMNIDPSPATGGGGITIVDNSALMPEEGPSGTIADIQKPEDGTIVTYIVQPGDTLSGIAQMLNTTTGAILSANDLPRDAFIQPGEELVILPVTSIKYTVQKGDTVESIAKAFNGDVTEIESLNNIDDSSIAIGQVIYVPNGEGEAVVQTASPQNFAPKPLPVAAATCGKKVADAHNPAEPSHNVGPTGTCAEIAYYIAPLSHYIQTQGIHGYNAVDLAAPEGTPIMASANGTVVVAKAGGWNGGYGSYVVISHGNGSQTLYGHMSKVTAYDGETVKQGEVIGYVGETGDATGPHVHFEIRNGIRNPF